MEKPGFGVELGAYKGVVGYSNRKSGWGAGPNYVNGHYTGYKYQCVEYARRWLILAKHLTFEDVNCAYNIWDLDCVFCLLRGSAVPLIGIPNGSKVPPVQDSILIYSSGRKVPWGHVAIITDVSLSHGYVRIAEQNEEDRHWPGDYSRQLRLEVRDGCYSIHDSKGYNIIGWMIYEDHDNHLAALNS